jgi:bifunctional non-homologous end joining protein LigD
VREDTRHTPRGSTRNGQSGSAELAGVRLTHPDRVLWEAQGLTKLGLAEFYAEIADWILPHVVNRPLALVRCPSGSQKECFFQKHASAGLDESVRRIEVPHGERTEEVIAIDGLPGLIGLVQAGVLEIHPWGSTLDRIEQPDRLIFDLDPGENVAWEAVIEGAREIRIRLEGEGLDGFVKTTGGKGLHVVVPLAPKADWEAARAFAKRLAGAMAADRPDRYTATLAKRARNGRIFVDYLRNARGATAVAAYSTRARPGAPVSTPLSWDELSPRILPNHFTVTNLPQRLSRLDADPWKDFSGSAGSIRGRTRRAATKR